MRPSDEPAAPESVRTWATSPGREPEVHRHGDGTEAGDGEERLEVRGGVLAEQCDPVAGLDPAGGEGGGAGVDAASSAA